MYPDSESLTRDRSPQTAIILAAGSGQRLGPELSQGLPKCLLRIGRRTLLEHQVAALAAAGIRHVALVVGHQAAAVRAAARLFATRHGVRFTFIENPRYAETNTLYSQYLARHELLVPCVCLNGDVLFPPSLIGRLLAFQAPGPLAVLAVDVKRCGDEEVKVVTDEGGRIGQIGKGLDPVRSLGEFIGVACYRGAAGAAFAQALAEAVERRNAVRDYFELALSDLADKLPLHALLLHGEPVIEIDFPADLSRARSEVLPRIKAESAGCNGCSPPHRPEEGNGAGPGIEVVMAPELPQDVGGVSAIQQSIYLDHVRLPGSHVVSLGLRLHGPSAEAPAAVRRALAALVRRHALLRSRFVEVGGQLTRRILPFDAADPFATDGVEVRVVEHAGNDAALRERLAEEAVRPFVLDAEPPVRALVVRRGPGDAVVQLSLHHLAYDAASVLHLLDDLITAAGPAGSARPAEIGEDPPDYARFVAWERRFLDSPAGATAASRWHKTLHGASLGIALPLPAESTHRQWQVGASLSAATLQKQSAALDVSPFLLVLAAYFLGLSQHLSQDSLSIGSTVSLRDEPGLGQVFGPVFNYVPILADLRGAGTLPQALSSVRPAALSALRGRRYPFLLLRKAYPALGEPAALGLNVNFNYYDHDRLPPGRHLAALRSGAAVPFGDGLSASYLPLSDLPVVRPYDLNLSATRSGPTLQLGLRYRAGLLSERDAAALLSRIVSACGCDAG